MGSEEVPDSTCREEERAGEWWRGRSKGSESCQVAYSEEVCDVDSSLALAVHITKKLWRENDHPSPSTLHPPPSVLTSIASSLETPFPVRKSTTCTMFTVDWEGTTTSVPSLPHSLTSSLTSSLSASPFSHFTIFSFIRERALPGGSLQRVCGVWRVCVEGGSALVRMQDVLDG